MPTWFALSMPRRQTWIVDVARTFGVIASGGKDATLRIAP